MGLFGALIMIIFIVSMMESRRRQSEAITEATLRARACVAAASGLTPLEVPDSDFVDSISRLFMRGDDDDDEVTVANVFTGDRFHYKIYMLDVSRRRRPREAMPAIRSIVAIRSSQLAMPRISLQPKLDTSDGFSAFVGSILLGPRRWFAPLDLTRIELPDIGDVAANYEVFAADPTAARAVLTERVVAQLGGNPWLAIEAEGDLLAVSRLDCDEQRSGEWLRSMGPQAVLTSAIMLYQAWSRS